MTPLTADDRAAFMRAVCESLDDDLPRLILADRLDEAGEPVQATMIRRGCGEGAEWHADNMSRLIPNGHGASRHLIGKWMRRGIGHPPRGFIGHLRASLPPPIENRWCRVRVRRGFVAEVECDWSWWVAHVDNLPTVTGVALTTWPSSMRFPPDDGLRLSRGTLITPGNPDELLPLLSIYWPRVTNWTLPPNRTGA